MDSASYSDMASGGCLGMTSEDIRSIRSTLNEYLAGCLLNSGRPVITYYEITTSEGDTEGSVHVQIDARGYFPKSFRDLFKDDPNTTFRGANLYIYLNANSKSLTRSLYRSS